MQYDIYDSIHPAIFERLPNDYRSRDMPQHTSQPLTVVLTSEFRPGSTGYVHGGKLLTDSDHTVPICVKLAFSEEDKGRLSKEHSIYRLLTSHGVQGIPYIFGIFREAETAEGAEGPHALVITYAGVTLSNSKPLEKRVR